MGFEKKGFSKKHGGLPYKNPVPDPLAAAEYADDLEQDSKAELGALEQGFRDRMKAEDGRFKHAVDAEFWTAICFRSSGDREKFFAALGVDNNLYRGRYIDGYELARKLGVDLDSEGR